MFWGWGCEDDDLQSRLRSKKKLSIYENILNRKSFLAIKSYVATTNHQAMEGNQAIKNYGTKKPIKP